MAIQNASQDENKIQGLLVHAGTAGTAETIRATGQASGAVDTHITGGTVISTSSGTNINIVSGTQQTLGTVGVVNNVGGGTMQIDSLPARTPIQYGTLGTTGAEVRGTMVVAAGAGDNYYLGGFEILVHSGTVDTAIEFGTKAVVGGADTFGRGNYVPGGGANRDFHEPIVSPGNGTITYYMGGAGTVFFGINYYEVG